MAIWLVFDDGDRLKLAEVLVQHPAHVQVRTSSGKQTKIKRDQVLLELGAGVDDKLLVEVEHTAQGIDVDLLWASASAGAEPFEHWAQLYFGQRPSVVERLATYRVLVQSVLYFRRRSSSHFEAAKASELEAALAGQARREREQEQVRQWAEHLATGQWPQSWLDQLQEVLFERPRQDLSSRALAEFAAGLGLPIPQALDKVALLALDAWHLGQLAWQHLPDGWHNPEGEHLALPALPQWPVALTSAISVDDFTTTEIDDALSFSVLEDGSWRVGIHIAAPASGIAAGTDGDAQALLRMSSVYIPGDKAMMLPQRLNQLYSLNAGGIHPVLSLYVRVDQACTEVLAVDCVAERISIRANLRHEDVEPLNQGHTVEVAPELTQLLQVADLFARLRGVTEPSALVDHNLYLEPDKRVRVVSRSRGGPSERLTAEMMIFANHQFGEKLKQAGVLGLFRGQSEGKVQTSVRPVPHEGLGLSHYLWATSPLRRYVDMVNQRQLLAVVTQQPAPYQDQESLLELAQRFEVLYGQYRHVQDHMERYWALQWLIQQQQRYVPAQVLRPEVVRLLPVPLDQKIPGLRAPVGEKLYVEVLNINVLDLSLKLKPVSAKEALSGDQKPASPVFDRGVGQKKD